MPLPRSQTLPHHDFFPYIKAEPLGAVRRNAAGGPQGRAERVRASAKLILYEKELAYRIAPPIQKSNPKSSYDSSGSESGTSR